jgi:glycosyltransferase involved in cell wall biosynthesis
MKIVHFLPWYSPHILGGTELFLLEIAKAQQKEGHEVEIMCPNIKQEDEFDEIDGIKISCFSFPYGILDPLFLNGLKPFDDYSSFKAYVRDSDPDIIHFHGLYPHLKFYVKVITDDLKIPTVVTPHLVNFTCPMGTLKQNDSIDCNGKATLFKCTRCLYTKSSGTKGRYPGVFAFLSIIVLKVSMSNKIRSKIRGLSTPFSISSKLKFLKFISSRVYFDSLNYWYSKVLQKNFISPVNIGVYANPVFNKNNYLAGNAEKVKSSTYLKLLFVGRLSFDKGLHVLLNSLKLGADFKNQIELTVAGKVVDAEILELVNDLKEENYKINYSGEISNLMVQELMQTADYLVFPSQTSMGEMLPLTIQESFRNNLPVIASDLPACKGLIMEGINGFLFNGGVDELATVLYKLWTGEKRILFKYTGSHDNNLKEDYYSSLYADIINKSHFKTV